MGSCLYGWMGVYLDADQCFHGAVWRLMDCLSVPAEAAEEEEMLPPAGRCRHSHHSHHHRGRLSQEMTSELRGKMKLTVRS